MSINWPGARIAKAWVFEAPIIRIMRVSEAFEVEKTIVGGIKVPVKGI